MKYRRRFAMILGVILLVSAGCAGVASMPSGTPTPSGTPGSQPSPSGSQAPATTTSAQAQVVHVTLSDQQISADHSTLYAGMPYHFVVTNTGQVAHQFMMGPWGRDYGHMSMGERHQAALYMYDQVAPGATKTFDYTFPTSAVGQRLGFACYQQGCCDEAGMWFAFTVQAHP